MKNILFILGLCITLAACDDREGIDKGDALFKQGKYQEAVDVYTKYLDLKPANEIVLYNRGRAYEELEQYDKAVADFKKVLKINPKSDKALLSIGKEFYRNEDYANAAFQFEEAFKANPQNAQAALLLARANHKAGEVDIAMEFYDKAISLKKDYAEAYMYRGALKIFLNKTRSGCSDIEKAKNLGHEAAAELYKEYCG